MRKLFPAALLCGLAACSDVPSATAPSTQIAPQRASLSQSHGTPIPGRYIVQFRKSSSTSLKDAALVSQSYGGAVEHVYGAALNGAVMTMSATAAAALRSDVRVLSIEQDQVFSVSSVQSSPPSWGLDRIDQRARPLDQSFTYNVSGAGVTAYIIDTGINFAQADFGGRAVTGYDAITAGGTALDCNGHGTHTAGTVGSNTYGVAKGVRLVAVRVMDCAGSGTTSSVIAGVDWVTRNVTRPAVANMSLGGSFSAALNTAVENSILAGITYAVSAGNSTADACGQSPAAAPNVISVGATGSSDDFASFSNFGSCVHINAPGVNITSLWIGASGTTTTISGTSMASPHVAGVAALYLQANPSATPAQVRSALTSNATPNVITGVPASTPNLLLYEGFIGSATAPVAPVARFNSTCTALSCSFDATPTTALASATYSWNFGDGSTASGKIVSRTYAASGTYNATLTVTDANGSNVKTRAMTVAGAANQSPTATISAPAVNAVMSQGVGVSFAGSASDPEDGALSGASLVWTSSINGQIGTGTSFTKTNLSAGTHTIALTATDSKGATSSATRTITVTAAANQPPTATISTPTAGSFAQGVTVSFAGSATDPEDGALAGASLVWTSSINGQIGTGASFTKNNLSVGSHTITLTAKDSKGATTTVTRAITITGVNQAPVAAFTWNCATGITGQCTLNGGTSTDDVGVVSYFWDWGNGRSESHVGSSARNTWTPSGTYNVTLKVTDGSGLTSSVTKAVIVP
ncbi:MAG: peptidase and in kexin sedolisin [Gemmatimonadetes bacterium]|nr:peptidase and in kexin sedolisin [Gemmatimonadota bacterium]